MIKWEFTGGTIYDAAYMASDMMTRYDDRVTLIYKGRKVKLDIGDTHTEIVKKFSNKSKKVE